MRIVPTRFRPNHWIALVPAVLACASCAPRATATVAATTAAVADSAATAATAATDEPIAEATVATQSPPTIVAAGSMATSSTDAGSPPTAVPASADACGDPRVQELGVGWNFVFATAPLAGEHVTTDFHLRGCGDVFEASFGWRLRDSAGGILVEDFATMSCGTGCVGVFDETVAYPPVAQPSLASLEVYTTSMNDGAEIVRAVIPVVLH